MPSAVLALVAVAVFAWGALSGRLERADLTAPIVFVALGVLLWVVVPLDPELEAETVKLATEVTLVWGLFSDAVRVGIRELRADTGVYGRLLGGALPLTVLAGWLLAASPFRDLGLWLALLVGAALAPTDAALLSVLAGKRVSRRWRPRWCRRPPRRSR